MCLCWLAIPASSSRLLNTCLSFCYLISRVNSLVLVVTFHISDTKKWGEQYLSFAIFGVLFHKLLNGSRCSWKVVSNCMCLCWLTIPASSSRLLNTCLSFCYLISRVNSLVLVVTFHISDTEKWGEQYLSSAIFGVLFYKLLNGSRCSWKVVSNCMCLCWLTITASSSQLLNTCLSFCYLISRVNSLVLVVTFHISDTEKWGEQYLSSAIFGVLFYKLLNGSRCSWKVVSNCMCLCWLTIPASSSRLLNTCLSFCYLISRVNSLVLVVTFHISDTEKWGEQYLSSAIFGVLFHKMLNGSRCSWKVVSNCMCLCWLTITASSSRLLNKVGPLH